MGEELLGTFESNSKYWAHTGVFYNMHLKNPKNIDFGGEWGNFIENILQKSTTVTIIRIIKRQELGWRGI